MHDVKVHKIRKRSSAEQHRRVPLDSLEGFLKYLRGLFARWGATAVARGCAFAANAAEAVAFYDCGSGGEVVGCELTPNARGGVVFGHGAREEDVRCSGNT